MIYIYISSMFFFYVFEHCHAFVISQHIYSKISILLKGDIMGGIPSVIERQRDGGLLNSDTQCTTKLRGRTQLKMH